MRRLAEVEPGEARPRAGRAARQGPGAGRAGLSESTTGGAGRAGSPDHRDASAAGSAPTPGSTPPTSRRAWSPSCRPTPTHRRAGSEARSAQAGGASPAVVIADSFGRAWRMGQADVAIGCAGWRRSRTGAAGSTRRARALRDGDRRRRRARLGRGSGPRQGLRRPGAIVAGRGDVVTAEDGPGRGAAAAAARRGPVPLGEGRLLGRLELRPSRAAWRPRR